MVLGLFVCCGLGFVVLGLLLWFWVCSFVVVLGLFVVVLGVWFAMI